MFPKKKATILKYYVIIIKQVGSNISFPFEIKKSVIHSGCVIRDYNDELSQ